MGEIVDLKTQVQRRGGGPRTEVGKRRSSLNAMNLGVYSRAVVIRGVEDPAEFERIMKDVLATNEADDPVVALAAERLVSIAWRLRRVRRVEAEKLTEKASAYTAALQELETARGIRDSIARWAAAVAALLHDSVLEARVVADAEQGIQAVLSGQARAQVAFESRELDRIADRGRNVRRKTAQSAVEAARKQLPEELAGVDLVDFLVGCRLKLESIARQAEEHIVDSERKIARELVGALDLATSGHWQDARSLSEAERRLDSQFSRALRDFHEARAQSRRELASSDQSSRLKAARTS